MKKNLISILFYVELCTNIIILIIYLLIMFSFVLDPISNPNFYDYWLVIVASISFIFCIYNFIIKLLIKFKFKVFLKYHQVMSPLTLNFKFLKFKRKYSIYMLISLIDIILLMTTSGAFLAFFNLFYILTYDYFSVYFYNLYTKKEIN